MTVVFIILGVVGALIIIPLVGGLFVSKEMRIEESIDINRPVAQVYDYVKYLRHSEQYNKWVMTDPQMKKECVGTDGTVGFIYKWDSQNKQVGKGEQEITGMQENRKIDYEIRFIKPYENRSFGGFGFEPKGNATRVHYSLIGNSHYMMRVMQFAFNIKKILSRDMQTTLVNLKNIMEK